MGPALAVAFLIAGCSSAPAPSAVQPPPSTGATPPGGEAALTQTSEGGQVTVVASWAGRGSGARFAITLDTHSVDLDALDLADAVLRNDRGETLAARPWTAPFGGHHRAGELSFDGDASAFFASALWIELTLSGIGDLPERVLRWEIAA